jgi:hypothetical protein
VADRDGGGETKQEHGRRSHAVDREDGLALIADGL